MSSFAVNDCLGATRHARYQRFAALLGEFSDPTLIACLRFSALDGCLCDIVSFIKHFLHLASPMAMMSGKVTSVRCGFRAGLWGFAGTFRNSAGTYCCTF